MDEVRLAVKQIDPLKVPGPDGMHAIFYQKIWNIMGKSIYHMIKVFLQHGYIFKELNGTYITLIPKKRKSHEG